MPLRLPITVPATVTLGGLRVDDHQRSPVALRGALVPWHQVARVHEGFSLPLDSRGRQLRHEKRSVHLKLGSSRARRAAERALCRAIRCRVGNESMIIRLDQSGQACGVRAATLLITGAVLVLCIFGVVQFAGLARELVEAPSALMSLAVCIVTLFAIMVLAIPPVLIGMWQEGEVLRLKADERGVRIVLTGRRRLQIRWADVREIAPTAPMLRLHSGRRLWLPRQHAALRELLTCVREDRRLRRSMGPVAAYWLVVAAALPVLSALSLWWNVRAQLLPYLPPQTLITIAMAPTVMAGAVFGLHMWAGRRQHHAATSAPRPHSPSDR